MATDSAGHTISPINPKGGGPPIVAPGYSGPGVPKHSGGSSPSPGAIPVLVNPAGGVKIGNTEYTGSAVVPQFGMTAQQFSGYASAGIPVQSQAQAQANVRASIQALQQQQAQQQNMTLLKPSNTLTSPTNLLGGQPSGTLYSGGTTGRLFQSYDEMVSPRRYHLFNPIEKGIQRLEEGTKNLDVLRPYAEIPVGAIGGGVGVIKSLFHPGRTAQSVVQAVTHPRETGLAFGQHLEEKGLPYVSGELAGSYYTSKGLITAGEKVKGIIEYPFLKKPTQSVPTAEMQKSVEPFTRQSSRLMLKDSQGNYVLGKTQSGELISLGGGIEKGQTARQSALMELKQETGLSLKDISNFQSAGKIVTPEETFHLFTGTIKDLNKIQPASDITSIQTISSTNPFIRGVTGQTAIQPISRYVPFVGKVRAYEAGIINQLETGQPMTWLGTNIDGQQIFFGTQSRYNVPFSVQRQYMQGQQLSLAHGTTGGELVKGRFNLNEKTIEVSAEASQRGSIPGLYLQPPVSATEGSPGYVGLSYLGFKTPGAEYGGIRIGTPSAYLFKEAGKYPLQLTPKSLAGTESELIIAPGTQLSSVGSAERISLGLKNVALQPSKILGDAGSFLRPTTALTESIATRPTYYSFVSPAYSPLTAGLTSASMISSSKPSPSPFFNPGLPSKSIINVTPSKASTPPYSITPSLSAGSSPSTFFSPALPSAPSLPSPSPSIPLIPSIPPSITRPLGSETFRFIEPRAFIPSERKQLIEEPRKSMIKRKKGSGFDVFIKKKGKYQGLGLSVSYPTARAIGERNLLRGLQATAKIRPSGRPVNDFFVPAVPREQQLFRFGHVRKGKLLYDPLLIIQRRGRRLVSSQERQEFKQARRGKVKSFSWF